MKHGTDYARHIKRLYHSLVNKYGKPPAAGPTDPLQQLVIGILAVDASEAKAQAVFGKLSEQMVDLNEMRVTPAIELAAMIGNAVPHAADKAKRIVDVLNAIRRRQDALDLSFLKQRARREAREYLESLEGVPPSAAASVVLFSLGGHAIPVDYLTLHVLRKEGMVEPTATREEVQAFLERNVPAADALAFVHLLGKFVILHGGRISEAELAAMAKAAAPKKPLPLKPVPVEEPSKPVLPRSKATQSARPQGAMPAPVASSKGQVQVAIRAEPGGNPQTREKKTASTPTEARPEGKKRKKTDADQPAQPVRKGRSAQASFKIKNTEHPPKTRK